MVSLLLWPQQVSGLSMLSGFRMLRMPETSTTNLFAYKCIYKYWKLGNNNVENTNSSFGFDLNGLN